MGYFEQLVKTVKSGFSKQAVNENIGSLDKASVKNLKYIFPTLRCFRRQYIAVLVLLFTSTLLTFPQPMLTRYLFNDALIHKSLKNAIFAFSVLGVIYLLMFSVTQFNNLVTRFFSRRVKADLQERIIDRTFNLPLDLFGRNKTGYLFSRLTYEIESIDELFSDIFPHIVLQFIRFFGGIIFLFFLKWELALLVLISVPVPLILSYYFSQRSYILSHNQVEAQANYSACLSEQLSNISLIKVFSNEEKVKLNLNEKIRHITKLSDEYAVIEAIFSSANNLFPSIARFITLIIGSLLIIYGNWDIGSLIAFIMYLGFVYGALSEFTGSVIIVQSIMVSVNRFASLFKITPENYTKDGIEVDKIRGNIEFKSVSFGYTPDKKVLNDVSFKICDNSKWHILGANGIGKTTLIYLLLQLYRPLEGEIIIDGKPSGSYDVRSIRRRFGLISQVNYILSGTFRDNLTFGDRKCASDEKIMDVAREVGIYNLIISSPDGLDSMIEEKGENLSEGEKRKLSIARSVIADPDVIIIDEADANLDNPSEVKLQNLVKKFEAGKTVLEVTHKTGKLEAEDNVIYIKSDGSLVQGRHGELLDKLDEYRYFVSI